MTQNIAAAHRLKVGEIVAPFQVETLSHGTLTVPSDGVTHLQFRRFAGCPICNLHLRAFKQKVQLLRAAQVQTVAFFHSSAAVMRPLQGELPFPVVADPSRRWYQRFAVEKSPFATLHPRAIWAALRGLVLARKNPTKGEGGSSGLPADFLIDKDGRVLAVHYGSHASDHWEVETVVALAKH